MSNFSLPPRRKALLIILDGFGVNPSKRYNAIYEAQTPNFDDFFGSNPHTTLQASGSAVGLPDGQMGNSEVGHITLGCGQIVKQDLVRIDEAVSAGALAKNDHLQAALATAKDANRPIHLIGLLSDGGVHSHIDHLMGLISICQDASVAPVLHAITDGRDTAPRVAKKYFHIVEPMLQKAGGHIATVCGRFFGMDRDQRWDRTEKAAKAWVLGEGEKADSADEAISRAYEADKGDEFVPPTFIAGGQLIESDDVVLSFNFRNDRPKQLVQALLDPGLHNLTLGEFNGAQITTMTHYDDRFSCPVLFSPQRPAVNLAEVISQAGIKQFHCAETEKYAHVTFFFNSGQEEPVDGEDRVVIPSPKVDTYDQKPEMAAAEVADAVIDAMARDEYGFVVVNFANGDMVGHTAVGNAVVEAVEALDREVGRVLKTAAEYDYSVLLTADHGNCDEYRDPVTGAANTQHTVYPVPCVISDESHWRLSTEGGLSNVAPTILQLMGLGQPEAMTGKSLLLQ